MCFSSPKAPSAPALPPAPQQTQSQAVTASRQAQTAERGRSLQRKGRQSTILTGPQGLQEEANIRRKTLLGA